MIFIIRILKILNPKFLWKNKTYVILIVQFIWDLSKMLYNFCFKKGDKKK
jgi:hypothetical protein